MKQSGFALVLGLALVCAFPGRGIAQTPYLGVSAEEATAAYASSRFQAALTLEVTPLDAQVFLDGRPIGSARELVAIAVPVAPGWHTVEIGAPGYYAHTSRFVADQHSSANLVVVSLVPVR
ncbi:MAG TPA: hypothetical protein VMS64_04475 [Candidatus Methylomirabilis sp.]|nr:hypothetical protein [Candidatus Methylomirabilis sp.]